MLYSQKNKISRYADSCINDILTSEKNIVKVDFINGISGLSFALSMLLRLNTISLD